uniref:Reverse transcriptase n=1 Tax=Plectus sambesii TaxID=2011161 RepID=A0A914VFB2_9BILA
MHINDTGNAKPIKQLLRPCPFALREMVNSLTQQYLKQGIISPSNSPWRSLLVIVKEKDSTPCYCIDMRAVKCVTKHLCVVFKRLAMANLCANPSICTFGSIETAYLGHGINVDSVKPDPAKVDMTANLANPRNLKKLQAFLDFAT